MTDITLTREELATLTGLKQPKRQAAWLRARQWVFEEPHGRGIPKVDRAYYLSRMSGQVVAAAGRELPRLDFFTKA
jgi:hypothetical protein